MFGHRRTTLADSQGVSEQIRTHILSRSVISQDVCIGDGIADRESLEQNIIGKEKTTREVAKIHSTDGFRHFRGSSKGLNQTSKSVQAPQPTNKPSSLTQASIKTTVQDPVGGC